jgi:hypothetical protein
VSFQYSTPCTLHVPVHRRKSHLDIETGISSAGRQTTCLVNGNSNILTAHSYYALRLMDAMGDPRYRYRNQYLATKLNVVE